MWARASRLRQSDTVSGAADAPGGTYPDLVARAIVPDYALSRTVWRVSAAETVADPNGRSGSHSDKDRRDGNGQQPTGGTTALSVQKNKALDLSNREPQTP